MLNMRSFLALICVTVLSGCEGEDFIHDFSIQQNGDVSLIPFQDFNGTVSDPLITFETVNASLDYPTLPDTSEYHQDLVDSHNEIIESNNGVIDNSLYQYIVNIPIATDKNIFSLPNQGYGLNERAHFITERCDVSYPYESFYDFFVLGTNFSQNDDGMFEYNLYLEANKMASKLMLNNVGDICIRYRFSSGGGSYASDFYKVTSNTLVISKDDIEHALSQRGISHE